jgi:FkbM family methyltransferase
MGLGKEDAELSLFASQMGSGGFSTKSELGNGKIIAKIHITSLDAFVKENNIQRIDFIKADIEGAERDMLQGAAEVLKKFAPKLAICTYHLPDDPEVLERIILDANPDYKIVQRQKKLYAQLL